VPVFRVPVQIIPHAGLLDPQGSAVAGALRTLGFADVQDVHVGRFIVVHTEAATSAAATEAVTGMCEKLLANPVTEDFVLESATEVQAV
jgi:phosphoribosylformylglycinamidine synthase PurS subunit